ncbi:MULTISPECIES: 3-methyl-2-oxobutanoate dehydrogenase subunit VorB [Sporomusa]|uniref:2-oxoglutarate oxidoreductase subunit KorA n=1 Tax=Sporomusa sphaeroides DSM 2875 TaxID=1337886 RepID=A0ABM9W7W2_9FIRM|nr:MULTISPECIES: 3-methyl-2-oxobutanoate dehydrogenase subunit VorB [Sporomusa]MCM0758871.1 3-methyl-2-oxobutanoate dehydrogenase subunit VorB [Sporomusa sphaeroides DSM 2875]OLS54939.1 2-oxoglutarate oxidoreductase subunit KorA [Sporomusa sphaeroides DSM 2875]CVK21230.1 2-oxoglutarate oxidoreductase subunit KorA [Sporomusa sphaeroides DSM 2875]
MAEKVLMKGNEAIGEAAVIAGCRYYFGYPITPQSELIEYMAKRLPQVNGVFLQAESEVAAINMVYGAAGAGARVMTSSSSPGVSLKQEGISYIAAGELPCVIVNIMRGGPGLGGIQPGQADYFQATKGGGHGDYHCIVVAPNSVQEMAELTVLAFNLADQYRNPVMLLGDGALGQMMEPVDFHNLPVIPVEKPWATTGMGERDKPNIIDTLRLNPEALEAVNDALQKKYALLQEQEVRWEETFTEDAELVLVAYGISSRVAYSAMEMARAQGYKVGLFRPITLWPFPKAALLKAVDKAAAVLTIELSAGQMVEDVSLAIRCSRPVHFYGRTGGMMMSPQDVYQQIVEIFETKGGK